METERCTATREAGTYKKNVSGETRTFGGLNVLLIGDFWQLDPPGGASLCKVPDHLASDCRKYAALPRAARGLEILHSVQGVTELTEPIRCKDKWYNALLEACRFGRLSDNNYAFLHGERTSVPGSWLGAGTTCGNSACAGLPALWKTMARNGAQWDAMRALECKKCAA